MQAFRKLLHQLSAVVLISVRSCLFRFEFHFKALLNCTFMIPQKDGELNHPGLQRHTEELFPFLSYDKPCGELALGKNCIRF